MLSYDFNPVLWSVRRVQKMESPLHSGGVKPEGKLFISEALLSRNFRGNEDNAQTTEKCPVLELLVVFFWA
jgi:hypothetical protein